MVRLLQFLLHRCWHHWDVDHIQHTAKSTPALYYIRCTKCGMSKQCRPPQEDVNIDSDN
jgi:Uri superfamily endonuclease